MFALWGLQLNGNITALGLVASAVFGALVFVSYVTLIVYSFLWQRNGSSELPSSPYNLASFN